MVMALHNGEERNLSRGKGSTDERSLEHNKQSGAGIIRLAVKIYVGRRCDVRTMTIKEV